MELRVLRVPFSTNVERVALALAHKDLAVTWVDVDDADRSAVRALSGQDLVPVLETGEGEVVADSMAIIARLEALAPEPALWPADAARRVETDIAIEWFNEVWKRPPNAIAAERGRLVPDETAMAADAADLARWLPWFEALLDGRDFLLGEELGAFDVVAFPFLKYGTVVPEPGDDETFHHVLAEHLALDGAFPRLAGWIARVDALPRA